jgi:hypothetical protein
MAAAIPRVLLTSLLELSVLSLTTSRQIVLPSVIVLAVRLALVDQFAHDDHVLFHTGTAHQAVYTALVMTHELHELVFTLRKG